MYLNSRGIVHKLANKGQARKFNSVLTRCQLWSQAGVIHFIIDFNCNREPLSYHYLISEHWWTWWSHSTVIFHTNLTNSQSETSQVLTRRLEWRVPAFFIIEISFMPIVMIFPSTGHGHVHLHLQFTHFEHKVAIFSSTGWILLSWSRARPWVDFWRLLQRRE